MICIYKDERLTLSKHKSRNRNKSGSKSRYMAVLHYRPMSKVIKFMVNSQDIPKIIAEHTANFIATECEDKFSIHYNGESYTKMKECSPQEYKDFVKDYGLKELYSEDCGNFVRHYLK